MDISTVTNGYNNPVIMVLRLSRLDTYFQIDVMIGSYATGRLPVRFYCSVTHLYVFISYTFCVMWQARLLSISYGYK